MSFSVLTDPAHLPNPSGNVSRKSFQRVLMSSDISGASFVAGATANFQFSNTGRNWLCPSESYLLARVSLSKSDGSVLNGTNSTNLCLAFNCVGGLFESSSHSINDTIVSQTNNYALASAVQTRMSSNESYRSTSGVDEMLVSDFTLAAPAKPVGRLQQMATKITHDLKHTPALSLYRAKQLIPPSCRHQLQFNVATGWDYRIIEASGAAAKTSVVAGTGLAANNYTVTVTKLEFFACFYEHDADISGSTIYLDTRELSLVSRNLAATSEEFVATVKPSTYRCMIFHQDVASRAGTGGRAPATHFKSSTDQAYHTTLASLQLSYAGQQVPQIPYSLSYTAANNVNGYARALRDSAIALGYCDEEWESLNTWSPLGDTASLGPMFAMSLIKPSDDRSTEVVISSTWTAAPTAVVQWICAESLSTVSLSFNSASDCDQVSRVDR